MSEAGEGVVEVRPGRSLAWTAVGEGPPLLLLNGYAATGTDWDPSFLGLLAADHRVIRPDNVGLGRSILAADDEVGGVEGMAADTVALLDALEIERAAVVGWSMGGMIAQALARTAPRRVAALGLISTHPGGPESVAGEPAVWRRLIDHSGTPREQASRLLALLFPPDVAPDADRRFGGLVAEARAKLPERVLFMQEDALRAWHGRPVDLVPTDPALPVAVVHGGVDRVVPPANAEALARVHPGATVEIRPDCAHAVMASEPVAVAEAILAATRRA